MTPRKLPVLLAATASLATYAAAQPAEPIRWATIGASITQGSGYPAKLQALLGPAFKVENEGVSGCTLLKRADFPYWTQGKLAQTFAFKPHIVSVDLGGNDSKPQNWAFQDDFIGDYQAMIDTLGLLATKPRIIPCTPQPSFQRNGQWPFGITNTVIRDGINPKMRQIASANRLTLADTYTPQEKIDLTSDGVHPDPAKPGADSIAMAIFRAFRASSIRWACIGNSITDNGHNAAAYPVKLNQLLGRDYFLLNAGHSGYTLLRKGDYPYHTSPWLKEVFRFQPNIVTIKLGTNDSKPHNWNAHRDEYIPDLKWLLDTLGTMASKPRVILLTPVPVWKAADGSWPFGINGDVVKNEVIPKLKQVAAERNLALFDLHTPYLPYQSLTPDGVHPNGAGLDTLAHLIHRAYKALPTPTAVEPPAARSRSVRREAATQPAAWANPLAPYGADAAGRRLQP